MRWVARPALFHSPLPPRLIVHAEKEHLGFCAPLPSLCQLGKEGQVGLFFKLALRSPNWAGQGGLLSACHGKDEGNKGRDGELANPIVPQEACGAPGCIVTWSGKRGQPNLPAQLGLATPRWHIHQPPRRSNSQTVAGLIVHCAPQRRLPAASLNELLC